MDVSANCLLLQYRVIQKKTTRKSRYLRNERKFLYHILLNECVSRAFSTAGIPVKKEPTGLAHKLSQRRKTAGAPDGCTLILWRGPRGGKPLAWDVTVCTTVADSYLAATSQDDTDTDT